MQPTVAPTMEVSTVHASARAPLTRADGSSITILVVDGERIVAEMISMALRCEGAEVVTAGDGMHAISVAGRSEVDMAIVDPRLPDMDGIRCVHTLREQQPGIRVLLLSAAHGEPDRATRVAVGEHWLSKPFSLEEVLLKVRVVLRRTGIQLTHNQAELIAGDLVLNEDSREVVRGGDPIHLSYTEFELLRFFVRNKNRVVTKRQILSHVWPYDFSGRSSVVELYVSYLRKKIDANRTPLIRTLRRTGYILKSSV